MRRSTFALFFSAGAVCLGQIFNVFGQGDEGARAKVSDVDVAFDRQNHLETLSLMLTLSRQSVGDNSLTQRDCKFARDNKAAPDRLFAEYQKAVQSSGLDPVRVGLVNPKNLERTKDGANSDIKQILQDCDRVYPSGF